MRRENLLSVELDDVVDSAGFRHVETSLTPRLGSRRMGVSVYEIAEADMPVYPYHFHHGVEEWLYVLSGAPTLREPDGLRTLVPGDIVCFPDGPGGAHQVRGPGRFAMFSVGEQDVHDCVFPDSDKLIVPDGMVLRRRPVGYWHGEGTGEVDPDELPPAPVTPAGPPRPVLCADTVPVESPHPDDERDGFRERAAMLGPELGAARIGATVYEFDPGEGGSPYHYEWGREEWAVVLDGAPTLRHPDGEDTLAVGDLVFFPEGPAGAHRLLNRSATTVRVLCFSTKELPSPVYYPDSGKWFIRNPDRADSVIVRADEVHYWDGEA